MELQTLCVVILVMIYPSYTDTHILSTDLHGHHKIPHDRSINKSEDFAEQYRNVQLTIPSYSGTRLFEHPCEPDEIANLILKDVQKSPNSKAVWLHEHLCRRSANLVCHEKERICKCMDFGKGINNITGIWDQIKVRCLGQVGSSCRTANRTHPGIPYKLLHRPECIDGAYCEDYVYDTLAVCQCKRPYKQNNLTCVYPSRRSGGVKTSKFSPFSHVLITAVMFYLLSFNVVSAWSWSWFPSLIFSISSICTIKTFKRKDPL